ncbi:MAG TPA: efflux RND transporter periplasmic adaptor subunit [Rhodobiaceae bacterium]|nr:efflux RND transporter periplasmic adaptor subunit [Rhodobiaceae bacterium]
MTGISMPESPKASIWQKVRKKQQTRLFWILAAVAIFVCVVLFLVMSEDTIDIGDTQDPKSLPLVTVELVSSGPERVEVSAFAEVRPRWSAELRSAVSGRVSEVLQTAFAGAQVEAGTTLLSIEASKYAADLAAAELALEEAMLALWEARNATTVARRSFQRSGTNAPNDLALKLPQLAIAQNTVKTAEARVAAAHRQLDDAVVTAPFSAFVTKRFVSPGQTVNVGDQLVTLVDNSKYQLEVGIGRDDWDLLDTSIVGLRALVLDQKGDQIAQAIVRDSGGFLDQKTRQYQVFLEIDAEEAPQVISGDFVRVLLPGITVPDALNIPASALTQEGYVWYVDTDSRLQRFEPEILFRRQDRVVIRNLQTVNSTSSSWRIAVTPLLAFLPGQEVRPQEVGG